MQIMTKNTEGFCIIQVDDNVFCKPVTYNHKRSMYLFTSIELPFILSEVCSLSEANNCSNIAYLEESFFLCS